MDLIEGYLLFDGESERFPQCPYHGSVYCHCSPLFDLFGVKIKESKTLNQHLIDFYESMKKIYNQNNDDEFEWGP